MDKSRYPADWDMISQAVRYLAGNCCEWCGAPNGAVGTRDKAGYFWPLGADGHYADGSMAAPERLTRIILTVAHLGAPLPGEPPWHGNPHDKHDVRQENLAALCQRCHLGYDLLDHLAHAAETRRGKRVAAGQLPLMEAHHEHTP